MADDKRYRGFWIGHLAEGERNRIHSGGLYPQESEMLAKGEDPWAKFRGPLPPNIPAYIPPESKRPNSGPETDVLGGSDEMWWGHFYISHLEQEARDRIKRGEFEPKEIEKLAKGESPWGWHKSIPGDVRPPADAPPFEEWLRSVIERFAPIDERIRKAAAEAAKTDSPAGPNEPLPPQKPVPPATLLPEPPPKAEQPWDAAKYKKRVAERKETKPPSERSEMPDWLRFATGEEQKWLREGSLSDQDRDALIAELQAKDEQWRASLKPSPEQLRVFTTEENRKAIKFSRDTPELWRDIEAEWRRAQIPGGGVRSRSAAPPTHVRATEQAFDNALQKAEDRARRDGESRAMSKRLGFTPIDEISEPPIVSPPPKENEPQWHERPDLILAAILFCLGGALAIGLVLLPPGSPGARLFWLSVMFCLLAACELLFARFLGASKPKALAGLLIPLILVVLFGWGIWPSGAQGQSPTVPVNSTVKTNQPNPTSESRTFADVDAGYLVSLYQKYSSAQADEAVKTYIGKWIKVSGRVGDVSRMNGPDSVSMSVVVTKPDGWVWYVAMANFNDQRWKDRALVFQRDENVTVSGKITRVSAVGVL